MVRLKVKNVGPIKEGYNSNGGFLEFKGITLFIGNQGSGKSTIAKLFSTLSWIEKALVRKDFTVNHLKKDNRFKNRFLAYQNIHNYLSPNSYIEYIGQAYTLKYSNEQLEVKENENSYYSFPKIMYVPAERNLVSSVDRLDKIKNLPLPLYTFYDEYANAKNEFTQEGLELPILNSRLTFDKQGKSVLIGKDYQINLVEASSGFHSLVPLILVTEYLSKIIKNQHNKSKNKISREEEIKLKEELNKLLNNKEISDDIFSMALGQLSARYSYKSFINIVEEPEQNLFPSSQRLMLNSLLKYYNQENDNKLIITTHSPYIINYLTLAIKANTVFEKNKKDSDKISKIVDENSKISGSDVCIYELDDFGNINKLNDYKELPSDENYLNNQLGEFNDLFVKLLELESND